VCGATDDTFVVLCGVCGVRDIASAIGIEFVKTRPMFAHTSQKKICNHRVAKRVQWRISVLLANLSRVMESVSDFFMKDNSIIDSGSGGWN
jgi:hypothetical protein